MDKSGQVLKINHNNTFAFILARNVALFLLFETEANQKNNS
jgi:hypothetical protein